jgi:hypothetical protein
MTDAAKSGLKIRTSFDHPPIPTSNFDWSAMIVTRSSDRRVAGDDEPGHAIGHAIGHGATEQEAIADLLMRLGRGPVPVSDDLVTLNLPASEVEAIAAHVRDDAVRAMAHALFADAAGYWRRAGMLFAAAGFATEADRCLKCAEACQAMVDDPAVANAAIRKVVRDVADALRIDPACIDKDD